MKFKFISYKFEKFARIKKKVYALANPIEKLVIWKSFGIMFSVNSGKLADEVKVLNQKMIIHYFSGFPRKP